ncbi:MAG: hypothetical protein OER95_13125 [Acidimicrobiia bacterium]|nr:hypothetical protein [Acidimicrobiia bacterium]
MAVDKALLLAGNNRPAVVRYALDYKERPFDSLREWPYGTCDVGLPTGDGTPVDPDGRPTGGPGKTWLAWALVPSARGPGRRRSGGASSGPSEPSTWYDPTPVLMEPSTSVSLPPGAQPRERYGRAEGSVPSGGIENLC